MTSPTPDQPRPRVRLRRNPRWLLAGVLAVALGGLSTAFLFMSVTSADPVLRVNRTVYRGETIRPADVSVIAVARGIDLKTVSGAHLDEVVGSTAVTDLPAGSLLVAGSYGPAGLAEGQSRVGLKLAAGRLPTTDLVPGTAVLLVALPAASATEPDANLPPSVAGTLATAPVAQPDGGFVLDVSLASDRAEAIARLAAADRLAVVRQGGGR